MVKNGPQSGPLFRYPHSLSGHHFNSRPSPASLSIHPIVRRITVFSACALALIALIAPPLVGADAPTAPPNPRFTGSPSIQSWRTEDITGHPVNREVVVHPETGYVFVANSDGVLVFDGVRWWQIRTPLADRTDLEGPGRARQLEIDASGRVWTSTPNDVAVLVRPDLDAGETPAPLVARSINELFPPDADEAPFDSPPDGYISPSSYPWIMKTPRGMLVRSFERIFLFGPEGLIQSWNIPDLFDEPWWSEGALHVTREDHGIYRLEGDQLTKITTPGAARILKALPHSDRGTLWLTTAGP